MFLGTNNLKLVSGSFCDSTRVINRLRSFLGYHFTVVIPLYMAGLAVACRLPATVPVTSLGADGENR